MGLKGKLFCVNEGAKNMNGDYTPCPKCGLGSESFYNLSSLPFFIGFLIAGGSLSAALLLADSIWQLKKQKSSAGN